MPDGPAAEFDSAAFATAWPAVEARLHRMLVRAGLDRETARDVCQEVASRAPRQHVAFRNRTGLYRWAARVSFGVRWDIERRGVSVAAFPSGLRFVAVGDNIHDPEERAVTRLTLRELVAELSPDQQEAVLSLYTGDRPLGSKRERDRHALWVLRARARVARRWQEVSDGLTAVVAGRWVRWRARAVTRRWSGAQGMAALAGTVLGTSLAVGTLVGNASTAEAGARTMAAPAVTARLSAAPPAISQAGRPAAPRVRQDAVASPSPAAAQRRLPVEAAAGLRAGGRGADVAIDRSGSPADGRTSVPVSLGCHGSIVWPAVCGALAAVPSPG